MGGASRYSSPAGPGSPTRSSAAAIWTPLFCSAPPLDAGGDRSTLPANGRLLLVLTFVSSISADYWSTVFDQSTGEIVPAFYFYLPFLSPCTGLAGGAGETREGGRSARRLPLHVLISSPSEVPVYSSTTPESPSSDSLRSRLLTWSAILGLLVLLIGWLFRSVVFQGGGTAELPGLAALLLPAVRFHSAGVGRGADPRSGIRTRIPESRCSLRPTSSVLYPLKLIFFLPGSYWARYHAYILVHVLLAGLTALWAARRWWSVPPRRPWQGSRMPAAGMSSSITATSCSFAARRGSH